MFGPTQRQLRLGLPDQESRFEPWMIIEVRDLPLDLCNDLLVLSRVIPFNALPQDAFDTRRRVARVVAVGLHHRQMLARGMDPKPNLEVRDTRDDVDIGKVCESGGSKQGGPRAALFCLRVQRRVFFAGAFFPSSRGFSR